MPAAVVARLIVWLWFAAAVVGTQLGVLQRGPALVVPAIIFGLTAALLSAYFFLRPARAWIDALDLRSLVLLHVTRFIGFAFLLLHRRGELPAAFAIPAGFGDIIVAAFVLPVVFAPLDDRQRERAIVIWNMVGLVDILLVVATAARLNLADPAQLRPLARLPLSLLPTFLVPLIIASHVIIFARVARLARER
jgi:hypothetical protein